MAKLRPPSRKEWFDNCGGFKPKHDLTVLLRGIASGLLDEQDKYGSTALSRAAATNWTAGIKELLKAGANTELRYFRTGATALYTAMQEGEEPIVALLTAAGANPDAANYWGVTPREWAARSESTAFKGIRKKKTSYPEPRIQNAEHLADHHHPRFKIPARDERETIPIGTAVNLYVYGPRSSTKTDIVKVRVTAVSRDRPQVRYTATVETPLEQTHLKIGTQSVEFGPEHIATVFVARPTKKARSKKQ